MSRVRRSPRCARLALERVDGPLVVTAGGHFGALVGTLHHSMGMSWPICEGSRSSVGTRFLGELAQLVRGRDREPTDKQVHGPSGRVRDGKREVLVCAISVPGGAGSQEVSTARAGAGPSPLWSCGPQLRGWSMDVQQLRQRKAGTERQVGGQCQDGHNQRQRMGPMRRSCPVGALYGVAGGRAGKACRVLARGRRWSACRG